MYDTEALAVRVAQRTASMLRNHRISNVGDKIFVNLAITGAIHEALTIFQDVNSASETLPILFGEAVPGTYVNLTFNEIAEIVRSDDVLNRAIDLLRQMMQSRWRLPNNIVRDEQRTRSRERATRT